LENRRARSREAHLGHSWWGARARARRVQFLVSAGPGVFLGKFARRSVLHMDRRPASARDTNEPADATPAAEFMVWDRGQMKRAKVCCTCGQQMTWRRSWEKSWDTVKYCSDRCRTDGRRNNRISQRLHIAAARSAVGRSEDTVLFDCSVIVIPASEAMSESKCMSSHE
jgi:hypothetical protein